MSKTPRTDNIARGNHVVPTEWAEQLEEECESWKALAEERKGYWDDSVKEYEELRSSFQRMTRERDEARNEIVGWKNKWDCAVEMAAQAQADHDKAREEIKELREIIEIHRQIAINYQARAVKAEEHLKTLCTANKN